ncbi:DUF305 domain-containing protein [Nocardioides sp.]|uniref:DUF305 domain-containing protein n=1 Tax=Nocardioides sp. TaxID=35761 RepID=UPI0025DBDF25|nr:DUF305 domain-containing protein [Nocardioides sp.]
MRHRLPNAAAAAVLTLVLATAGCGSDDARSGSGLSATEHNDADVAFATDMIQHHAQALSMVDLTMGRPLDPEVQRLAEDIRAAQGPEIETMSDWLNEWGEEVPPTMRDHSHAGHDMEGMGESMEGMDDTEMPGMMSAEEMTALEEASDAEFQSMWLEMMVEHHEGAVEMAEEQQDDGRYRPAVDLAASITEAQQAEIDAMESMLER